MAERPAVQHIDDANGRTIGYKWYTVTSATSDTCAAVRITDFDDVTLSISGTVGGSSTALKISNDTDSASVYFPAKDANTAVAVALTATETAALVSEVGVWYKPVVTDGSAQDLDISLVAK